MICERLTYHICRFTRDDDGAALVEFGVLLPTMLLFFAMAIEGSRLFWSYQSAIAGVRDAARFVGRAAPNDICTTGGSITGYDAAVLKIVREKSDGTAMFPSSIQVTSTSSELTCVSGNYRLDQTPIATITADLRLTFPFASVFGMFGVSMDPITTSVTDSTRVFGA